MFPAAVHAALSMPSIVPLVNVLYVTLPSIYNDD